MKDALKNTNSKSSSSELITLNNRCSKYAGLDPWGWMHRSRFGLVPACPALEIDIGIWKIMFVNLILLISLNRHQPLKHAKKTHVQNATFTIWVICIIIPCSNLPLNIPHFYNCWIITHNRNVHFFSTNKLAWLDPKMHWTLQTPTWVWANLRPKFHSMPIRLSIQ